MSFYASMRDGLRKSRQEREDEVEKNVNGDGITQSSFDEEDDDKQEDSYDEMMTGAKLFPQISTPSVAPLNPFELTPPEVHHTKEGGREPRNPLDYSLEAENTMSSYYTSNGWDNTAAEEDDDEDSDYGKSDVLNLLEQERQVAPAKKRVTRMRSKSIEMGVNSSEKPKKAKKKKTKKSKAGAQNVGNTRERSNSYGKYSSSELNYGALFPSTHTLVENSAADIEVLSLNDVNDDDDEEGDESDSEGGGGSGSDEDMDSYDGTEEPNASLERSGGSSNAETSRSELHQEDQVMEFNDDPEEDDDDDRAGSSRRAKPSSAAAGKTVQFDKLSPKADSSIDLSNNEDQPKPNHGRVAKMHSVLSDDEDDSESEYKPSASRTNAAADRRRNPLDASVELPKSQKNSRDKNSSGSRHNPLDSDSDEEPVTAKKSTSTATVSAAPAAKDSWAGQSLSRQNSGTGGGGVTGSPQRPVVRMPSASPAPNNNNSSSNGSNSFSSSARAAPRDLDLGEPVQSSNVQYTAKIDRMSSIRVSESKESSRQQSAPGAPVLTEQEKAEEKRLRIERIKASTLKARQEREAHYAPSPEHVTASAAGGGAKRTVSQNRVSFEQQLTRDHSDHLDLRGHQPSGEVKVEEEDYEDNLVQLAPLKLYDDSTMLAAPRGAASRYAGSLPSPSHASQGSSNAGSGSPAVNPLSASVNRNPLYNSTVSLHTDASGATSTNSDGLKSSGLLCSLPVTLVLPPLTEFAAESGVIFEGYLNKKSHVTGLFQKRYFVLSESSTYFAVLRIYSRAVETKWGTVPVKLRSSIPIGAVESVITTANPSSKGVEFTIKFSPAAFSSKNPESGRFGGSQAGSDNGSIFSAALGGGANASKQTILHAEDAENRLLWVTILNKVLNIFLENLPE